jgi:HD-GYP domain-containing protein (c-di-GMP phosphodiesterase class II)
VPDLADAGPDPSRQYLINNEDFQSAFFAPLLSKGVVQGVLEVFSRTPLTPDAEWLSFLEALAGQAAIAIDNAQLFDNLQRSNQQLTLAYNATIEGWSRALDLRDKETEGHTQRVTDMTLRLARSMGLFSEEELVHIRRGALLHDIGKMGVPDNVLLKPGELDKDEEALMRNHPDYAYQLLSPILYLRKALDIPHFHHEHWDGSGYPQGLEGEQIPIAARIFAVVDVWDALRSDRPYRAGWPEDKVLAHIKSLAGEHFDPQVVEAFFQILAKSNQATH